MLRKPVPLKINILNNLLKHYLFIVDNGQFIHIETILFPLLLINLGPHSIVKAFVNVGRVQNVGSVGKDLRDFFKQKHQILVCRFYYFLQYLFVLCAKCKSETSKQKANQVTQLLFFGVFLVAKLINIGNQLIFNLHTFVELIFSDCDLDLCLLRFSSTLLLFLQSFHIFDVFEHYHFSSEKVTVYVVHGNFVITLRAKESSLK